MRRLSLILGLSGVVAMTVWACGSDVDPNTNNGTSSTASSGSGGEGGMATTSSTSTTTSSSTTTSANDCSGVTGGSCDKACCKIEIECGFGAICNMIPFLDCKDPNSECFGDCVIASDCVAIASLAGSNPDAKLMGCVQTCQGGEPDCQTCVLTSCGSQLQGCQGDTPCQAFLQCAQACSDEPCLLACATNNPSQATTDLLTCTQSNCLEACTGGGGGNGGGGGSGGAGGSGGSK